MPSGKVASEHVLLPMAMSHATTCIKLLVLVTLVLTTGAKVWTMIHLNSPGIRNARK